MRSCHWLLSALSLILAIPLSNASSAHTHGRTRARAQRAAQPAQPFSFETVQRLAQQRAGRSYQGETDKLPDSLAHMTYDQYQAIHFRTADALWHNQSLFEVQFFHRGFAYQNRVNINEVVGGVVHPVDYNPADFDFGKNGPPRNLSSKLGFAGLRVHYPLHTPDYKDEVLVFLGASYFRMLGREQVYGASARGLAVDVATTNGEEFPYFTDFWLVKPQPLDRSLTLYALLDSPSVAGAYKFELRPGTTTEMQVNVILYPRRSIDKIGLAPLTSMFLYGKDRNGARQFDDYHPEVHDSDGLLAQTGTGEWLWRPLVNRKTLNVSSLADENPRGFGLSQRERDFNAYQDDGARYQMRPSYWITPLDNWGKGAVELVEIPTDEAIHDNIVTYWVPAAPVKAHQPLSYSYLLSAYTQSSVWPPAGKVIATRSSAISAAHNRNADNAREMLIDFSGGDLDVLAGIQPVMAEVSAHGAGVDDVRVQRLPETGVWRVSFRLTPRGSQPADLRCFLTLYGEALTETWTYLWTP
jgi:periplasmic glucans biosynthesis protein